jgi:hypothetical protein
MLLAPAMRACGKKYAHIKPLHLKLGLWHAELIRTKSKPVLKREELKIVVMPRQQWLYKLDPDNSRPIQEVRQEVPEHVPKYVKLCKETDRQHEIMSLEDILTLSEKIHHLEWKGIEWSVSGWACSCPTCSKECVCTNNVLLEMVFNRNMTVPDKRERLPNPQCGRAVSWPVVLQGRSESVLWQQLRQSELERPG